MLVLNVATQPTQIAIHSERAVLAQKTIAPELSIEQEAAKVEINRSPAVLEIDSSPCRYARGIKTLAEMSRDNAQEGYSTAMEAIGRIAAEGDRLARIESKEDAVINLMIEHSNDPETSIEWNYVPLPDIRYMPAELKLQPNDGTLRMQYQRGYVQADYQPAKVDISVVQHANVKTWLSENKIDLSL